MKKEISKQEQLLAEIREKANDETILSDYVVLNALFEEEKSTINKIDELYRVLEELENYIREKYGDNYKYISSTTKCLFDKNNQEQELLKDYYLTVLNFDHNKDIEYIKTLPNKDKIEILCNPVCRKDCPMKKFHYRNMKFFYYHFLHTSQKQFL